jgi:uncharacterized membrane protein YgcG
MGIAATFGRVGGFPIIRHSARAPLPIALALALVALVGVAPAAPARAADIPRLEGTITDEVGVIGDRGDEVLAAIDAVREKQGVQVFVLFVDTTQEMTVTDFVDETARVNSLGADDALVLVAIDDRTDAIWVSDSLPISDDELNDVIAGTLEPTLRDDGFADAAIATAQALGAAAAEVVNPTVGPVITPEPAASFSPVPGGGGTDRGGIDLGAVVGIILLGLGLVVLAVWAASRIASRRETGERDRRLVRLARDANAQLIAADDRIRAAEQETGFVEAEFGEAEAAPFRAAVDDARRELRAAFALRQRLDDNDPEDPPTRESMLNQIVESSGRAGAALDAQAARIEELRSLERDAEKILGALPAQVEPVEARLPAADRALAGFGIYAPSAWAAVKGNAEEARKGLAGARAAIARGNEAVATDRSRAAREISIAQRGIAGAAALLDAIDKLGGALESAAGGVGDELAAAERDLADARDALDAMEPADATGPDGAGTAQARAADLSRAEADLAAAHAAANARPMDPIEGARRAAAARREAAELLAAVRRDAEQARRFAAAVESSIVAAQAEVDRAADFIETRRTGVRRQARTRLVEAERLLDSAIATRAADPKAAMVQAQRADKLAGEAYTLASMDFARWDSGRRGPGTGSDMAGAILGGIIGGILSGGGRGGGWGGSSWGSPGPFGGGGNGGGGWGGGHSAGGGFGGFGGGSGSSGGGGHSAGGRW